MVKNIDIEVTSHSSSAREIRGLDGKDGLTPTEDELLGLIIPLIPEPLEGPQGPIGPMGPQGRDGARGPAGDPNNVEIDILEELVKKHMPKANNGKDGKDLKWSDLTIEQKAQLEGPRGVPGLAGQGVPIGGTTGQVLIKSSNANFDTEWGSGTSTGSIITDPASYDLSDDDRYLMVDTSANSVNIVFSPTFPEFTELTITLIDDTNTCSLEGGGASLIDFSGNLVTDYDFTTLYQTAVYFRSGNIFYLK